MAVRGRSATTNYPPLMLAGLVMLLLLAVMPSALNLPQTSPAETLEYAPIPPEDDQITPPVGNLSSLGLGSSSSFGADPGGEPDVPAPGEAKGVGKNPRVKNCVGNPPKQTEDPLAPPCVGFYEGDNGGATYHGVTRDEIRILVYIEGGFTDCVTSKGCEERPLSVYKDLDEPPQEEDTYYVRQLRIHQRHFNDRYQTYGRRAHFFAYFTDGTNTVEGRRADAVENLERVKPFAVATYADNPDPYIEVMARRGVMNFGSFENKPAAFFSRFPKLIWSYLPSIEESAAMYSSWVCSQIVNRPVAFSGNAADQGKPRKFGFLSTADPDFPGMQLFAKTARQKIEKCGAEIVAEGTAPYAAYAADTRTAGEEATQNIAKFAQAGVTTVLWAQGYETTHSNAAAQQNWRPEWVIAGDGYHEGYQTGKRQDQSVWDHAWAMTNVVRAGLTSESYCYKSQRQDPSSNHQDSNFDCGLTSFYQDLRMLFTGIQVAGPKLTPTAVDRGMHAIPAIRSDDPGVPACFYNPGDYTCVKDAMVNWWDSRSTAPGQQDPGCWKMVEGGRRYFAGAWQEREAFTGRTAQDECNGYAGPLLFYAGTG
ncbi:MAG TPA: hypothetical protein VMY88_08455 [Acidimicrobiales bacterium]|nr:hypothetical protein [Acidimicrobiales bacterium]